MKYIKALIFVILLTVLDQFTKYLAVVNLKDKPAIPIIQDVFELQYLENRGSAFGMMQNQRVFFIIITIVIVAAFIWLFTRIPNTRRMIPMNILCTLIIAGAVGNFIDRLLHGYVVDFLYFKLIDFPVFNVADIYVTVSTIVFCLLLFFYYKEEDLERIVRSRK